jgi:hypothetical protein
MGLRPTHRDESPLLRFIDSKQVTRDFRRSVMASLEESRNHCKQGVGEEPLFMLRCDRSPVMLTLITTVIFLFPCYGVLFE